MSIKQYEDKIEPTQISDEYKEVVEFFPTLKKYQREHTAINLQKLCVEISDFCVAVYSSTRNDEERAIYKRMVEKLNK